MKNGKNKKNCNTTTTASGQHENSMHTQFNDSEENFKFRGQDKTKMVKKHRITDIK